MSASESFVKRHLEIFILAVGVASMLLIIPPSPKFIFSPPPSVFGAYALLAFVSFIRRSEDRPLSIFAAATLSLFGFLWYWRAYANWNSLGMILDYEMPVVTLGISLSAAIILMKRRLMSKVNANQAPRVPINQS